MIALNGMGCGSISAGGRSLFARSPDCASVAEPTPECPDPDAAWLQKERERLESRKTGARVARGFSIASIVVGSTILVGGGLLTGVLAANIEPCTGSDGFELSGGKFRSMDFDSDGDGGDSCGPGGAIAFGVTTGIVSVVLITLGAVGVVQMNGRIREIDKQLKTMVKPGPAGSTGLTLQTSF
jgi:hypothetical protein